MTVPVRCKEGYSEITTPLGKGERRQPTCAALILPFFVLRM